MAVFFYPPGALSSGFVGYRVATTLGDETQYAQKWFSLSDYSPGEARQQAYALNNLWRSKAEQAVKGKKSDYRSWTSIDDVPGLWAQIQVSKKVRQGHVKHYATPCFAVQLKRYAKLFRISSTRRDYLEAWDEACRCYIESRGLPAECFNHLIDLMPDPSLFYDKLYFSTPRVKDIISQQALIEKLAY